MRLLLPKTCYAGYKAHHLAARLPIAFMLMLMDPAPPVDHNSRVLTLAAMVEPMRALVLARCMCAHASQPWDAFLFFYYERGSMMDLVDRFVSREGGAQRFKAAMEDMAHTM